VLFPQGFSAHAVGCVAQPAGACDIQFTEGALCALCTSSGEAVHIDVPEVRHEVGGYRGECGRVKTGYFRGVSRRRAPQEYPHERGGYETETDPNPPATSSTRPKTTASTIKATLTPILIQAMIFAAKLRPWPVTFPPEFRISLSAW